MATSETASRADDSATSGCEYSRRAPRRQATPARRRAKLILQRIHAITAEYGSPDLSETIAAILLRRAAVARPVPPVAAKTTGMKVNRFRARRPWRAVRIVSVFHVHEAGSKQWWKRIDLREQRGWKPEYRERLSQTDLPKHHSPEHHVEPGLLWRQSCSEAAHQRAVASVARWRHYWRHVSIARQWCPAPRCVEVTGNLRCCMSGHELLWNWLHRHRLEVSEKAANHSAVPNHRGTRFWIAQIHDGIADDKWASWRRQAHLPTESCFAKWAMRRQRSHACWSSLSGGDLHAVTLWLRQRWQ